MNQDDLPNLFVPFLQQQLKDLLACDLISTTAFLERSLAEKTIGAYGEVCSYIPASRIRKLMSEHLHEGTAEFFDELEKLIGGQ